MEKLRTTLGWVVGVSIAFLGFAVFESVPVTGVLWVAAGLIVTPALPWVWKDVSSVEASIFIRGLSAVTLFFTGAIFHAASAPDPSDSDLAVEAHSANTAEEGLALMEEAMSVQGYSRAQQAAEDLLRTHPGTVEAQRAEELLPEIRSAARRQLAAEAEERRAEEARAKWTYRTSEDQMTSGVTRTASIRSENTVTFGFPYQGAQQGTLALREHPSFGRDVIFRIERGQIMCRSFDGCEVRVRFGDSQPVTWRARPSADRSSETVFLDGYDSFLSRMQGVRTVLIQPQIYQEGSPVFEFDVSGFQLGRYRGG